MPLPALVEKATSNKRLVLYVLIPLLSVLMHFNIFTRDLVGVHVWRQTQTQTNIENFAKEDFNILNPRVNNLGRNDVFRMEFPIMQWLYACFYKIFGDHIIISRILSFITGLFCVWGIYRLLFSVFNRESIALIGAWCFNFSPLFFYYTMNPLPDNFAMCAAIWGMAFFFGWTRTQKTSHLILSAALIGISVLAKLPFIICLGGIGAYVIWGLLKKTINIKTALLVATVFIISLIPAAVWYLSVIGTWQGNRITTGVLSAKKGDLSTFFDIMQFHLISTMPELMVNYGALLFFLAGWFMLFKNKAFKNSLFPALAFWGICTILYFFFEINMIAKTHDYYLFPFMPLLFLLVAYGAEQLLLLKNKGLKIFFSFALCILPVTAFLRAHHRWNLEDPGFNVDLYTYKAELRHAVPDTSLCVVGNDISGYIFLYYLDKKGWNFNNDTLNGNNLSILINKGARYLYSDSRKVDEDAGVKNLLDKKLMQKGSIAVYSLKAKSVIH